MEFPTISDITLINETDPVQMWTDKAHFDHFIMSLHKQWNIILKAERTQAYTFLEAMDPPNIKQQNIDIPMFVFENFAQQNISKLRDLTLEKKLTYLNCFNYH